MADDGLAWFENVLGAAAGDDRPPDMHDARCPKCSASDFINIPDLFGQSVARLEDPDEPRGVVRDGGLTDEQIVGRFAPPRPSSAVGVALAVAVPLGVIAFFVYRRVGDLAGQISIIGAIVLTLIVLMTMARKFSDKHYRARRRWRAMYLCRKCGQLVAS